MSLESVAAFEAGARVASGLMNRLTRQRDSFREETITDLLVLGWKEARLADVTVYKAAGLDESRFGFDLELWIGSKEGWYRYAVQAKKLGSNGRYNSLRQLVGTPPAFQIRLLRAYAHAEEAIPLYCFYNHFNVVTARPQRCWHCELQYDLEQLGCTVVPLFLVEKVHDRRVGKTFDVLHEPRQALPIRCLVRCDKYHPRIQYNPLDEAVALGLRGPRGLDGMWASSQRRPPRADGEPPPFTYPHRELPPHLWRAQDGGGYSADDFPGAAYPRNTVVVDVGLDEREG